MFCHHTAHLWAGGNPHGMRPYAAQHCFSMYVWASVVDNLLVGPYLLPASLTPTDYLILLKELLPSLCDPVPHVRRHMWHQHDGTPLHYGGFVREHLNEVFGHR